MGGWVGAWMGLGTCERACALPCVCCRHCCRYHPLTPAAAIHPALPVHRVDDPPSLKAFVARVCARAIVHACAGSRRAGQCSVGGWRSRSGTPLTVGLCRGPVRHEPTLLTPAGGQVATAQRAGSNCLLVVTLTPRLRKHPLPQQQDPLPALRQSPIPLEPPHVPLSPLQLSTNPLREGSSSRPKYPHPAPPLPHHHLISPPLQQLPLQW